MANGDENSSLTVGLAAAGSLVVGVLAAVGVAGDLLTRMVRNNPGQAAIPLYAVLAVAGLLAVVAASKAGTGAVRGARVLSVLMLVGALTGAVHRGVLSQDAREHPGVGLSIERTATGVVIKAKGTATSLRSNERMLLRVVAISGASEKVLRTACQSGQFETGPGALLLSWTETGPNVKGEAVTEASVPGPAGAWSHYCAFVALVNRPGNQQFNWSIAAAPPRA